jgi:hypothetical protein
MSKRIQDEDEDSSDDLSELSEEEEEEEDKEYLIEKLIADKFCPVRKQKVYLVWWEGYPLESATWEPISSFSDDQNHVIKDYERQKEEGEVNFDWQKWDREREKEAQEAEEKRRKEKALKEKEKQKRAEIRRKRELQKMLKDPTAIRQTRKPSPSLKGFVADDDSGLEEVSDGELQDLDGDSGLPERRARKKEKDRDANLRMDDDDDYNDTDSDDSLLSSIKKKNKSSKAKDNSKGHLKAGEQPSTKGNLQKKAKTRPGPAKKTKKTMAGTSLLKTTVPSKRRHSNKSPSPPPPRPRKRTTAAATSDQDSFIGESAPEFPKLFRHVQAVYRSNHRRAADVKAPPAEQLNLVKVGGSRPTTTLSIADIRPQPTSAATGGNGSAMEPVSSAKRKQTSLEGDINTPVSAQLDQVSGSNPMPRVENGSANDQLAPPAKRHRSEMYQLSRTNVSREDTPSRLLDEELFGSEPNSPAPSQGLPMSSEANTSLEKPRRADPIFECELLYGPSASTAASLGKVKFLGLSNDFLVMMSELQPEKLWVSRSLDTWFLLHYFLPVSPETILRSYGMFSSYSSSY